MKRLDHFHLFNGFLKGGKDGKGLEPMPQGLEILRNTVVFASGLFKVDKFTPLVSNERGILYFMGDNFANRTTMQMLHKKLLFQMIPENSLPLLWAAKGEKWTTTVNNFFKDNDLKGVELPVKKVFKSHLRPPEKNGTYLDSDEYRNWYAGLSATEPMCGFIIPKVRIIVVSFTSADFSTASVMITSPDGRKFPSQKVSHIEGMPGVFGVSFSDDKKIISEGLYKVEVSDVTAHLGAKFKTKQSYVFHEKVIFSTRSLVSEIALVLADGISLEESVLNQFPLLYENLVSVGRAKATAQESEVKSEFPEPPKALEKWVNRLQWIQGKSQFAVKIFNTNGTIPRSKKLANYIVTQNSGLLGDELKKGLDLCYGVYEKAEAWKKLKRQLSDDPEILKRATKLLKSEIGDVLEQNRWYKYLRESFVENPKNYFAKLDLEAMGVKGRAVFLKAGIPEEVSNLQKSIGNSAKVLEKAFIVADTAFSFVDTALAVNEVIGTKAKLQLTTSTFNDLVKQYKDKLSNLPNREGIGTLEKYRAMTVTGAMDVEVATAEACAKAFDAVLGTLTMVPGVGEIAGLVLLIKDTASLGVEALSDIDGWLFHHYFSSAESRHSKVSELMKTSYANQELMSDQAKEVGLEGGVQFRLRAEALNGLVGLLIRAAISTANDAEYLDKVRKYRVKEYIETFILNDGWQMPLYPSIPVSMDSIWLFTINPLGLFSDFDFFRSQFGYTKPLTMTAASGIPAAMGMLVAGNVVLAKHVKTHFHDSFPIHRMEAATSEEFCKSFRPNTGKKLGHKSIAYTRMYRRASDAKAEDPWMPYEPKEGKDIGSLPPLSPLDQIRILVVLEAGIEPGVYPISLRLFRTDGLKNLEGPRYQDIVRNLDSFLLTEEKEWKGKGRLGCVFYPFYQLGVETIPGIKPLAGAGIDMVGVNVYYAIGGLWNMTYGFKIGLGDDNALPWLQLGGKPDNRNSLNEFPVNLSIYKRPHERKLLIADFLQSQVTEFSYPTLFQQEFGFGPSYLKVGDAWYWLGTNAKKEFPHFDWHQPVEIIVTFWANHLGTEAYKKAGLDWGHTPLELTLHQAHLGLDKKGPTFSGRLTYLGQYHTAESKLHPSGTLDPKGKNIGEPLSPLLQALESGSADTKSQFEEGVDKQLVISPFSKKDSYHLFAAHCKLSRSGSVTIPFSTPC